MPTFKNVQVRTPQTNTVLAENLTGTVDDFQNPQTGHLDGSWIKSPLNYLQQTMILKGKNSANRDQEITMKISVVDGMEGKHVNFVGP